MDSVDKRAKELARIFGQVYYLWGVLKKGIHLESKYPETTKLDQNTCQLLIVLSPFQRLGTPRSDD